ncbi:MAG: cobalamin-dependent protein [Thermincola sp.]|jgi:methanogenic corrinoid protein MtbC1|nr:cobalamin-dependent protein [Thermincola sp.]MDT3703416.1 cobalamin-dependent protein [Thermincola sp.]
MDDQLVQAVADLDEKKVLKLVKQCLKDGQKPKFLIEKIALGMDKVGELYEQGEYFIADLIMAGSIFKDILSISGMKFDSEEPFHTKSGKIVLGTVAGDLHDIGKDIFKRMAEVRGYEVHDLGVNVPVSVFVEQVMAVRPHIVAMSGVLTLALESMKETVEGLNQAGLREQVKVLIGGRPVTREASLWIGADNYTRNAVEGLEICERWLNRSDTKRGQLS